jgi:uncharacterized protein YndB with AHSA1/START domain
METQTIRKSVYIDAPKEEVWQVLFNDKFTRIWYAEFSVGTHAETDWQVGSKAVFKDESGSGLVGQVLVNKPYEALSVEFQGVLEGGREDYDSEMAKSVKGARETYLVTETAGRTRLDIESDMAPEYFESMSAMWDKALQKVKELSETGLNV